MAPIVVRGALQSTASPWSEKKGSAVMSLMFGKNATKKYRKDHWAYDGESLFQFEDASEKALVGKYRVLPDVARVTSRQLDVDVEVDGERGKLSLKAQSAADLRPWHEALKKPTRQPKRSTPLQKLDDLRATFERLYTQVSDIDSVLVDKDPRRMFEAKGRIAQINGRLDKLQFSGIDSVVTSEIDDDRERLEAKACRKKLNVDVEAFRLRIAALHAALAEATATLTPTRASPHDPTPPDEDGATTYADDAETPLDGPP